MFLYVDENPTVKNVIFEVVVSSSEPTALRMVVVCQIEIKIHVI